MRTPTLNINFVVRATGWMDIGNFLDNVVWVCVCVWVFVGKEGSWIWNPCVMQFHISPLSCRLYIDSDTGISRRIWCANTNVKFLYTIRTFARLSVASSIEHRHPHKVPYQHELYMLFTTILLIWKSRFAFRCARFLSSRIVSAALCVGSQICVISAVPLVGIQQQQFNEAWLGFGCLREMLALPSLSHGARHVFWMFGEYSWF